MTRRDGEISTIYDSEITTWTELFNEISYNWGFTHSTFVNHGDGIYTLDKLGITPTEVSYKTSLWKLHPDVYQKFLKFLELFN
mgnify:CR=1 FL=1|jgi:hypothetical protein